MSTHEDPELPVIEPLSESSGLCGGPGQLSCVEANELIQSHLDKIIDAEADARVTEHLGDCPPCELEAVVYKRIIASLERCRPHVPEDTVERLNRFCSELRQGLHDGPIDD